MTARGSTFPRASPAAATVADPRPRKLVLLRHGRTEWNHARRAQGHADVPLDSVGIAQARAAGPMVAALRPARLWSSDLARARQTADIVAEECCLPVEEDPRLRDFQALVERRWAEYGLADLSLGEVDPNLFGYDIR